MHRGLWACGFADLADTAFCKELRRVTQVDDLMPAMLATTVVHMQQAVMAVGLQIQFERSGLKEVQRFEHLTQANLTVYILAGRQQDGRR